MSGGLEVDDPSRGQTLAQIEAYLRGVEEGDEVAIRNTHSGILEYRIATVTGTKPRAGRLYTDQAGGYGGTAWYMKSGKNCFYPGGQSRLFVPTNNVRAFAANRPLVLTYNTHTPE